MQMRYPDERETEQIGKLIDAGHPRLAAAIFRSRWRYRFLTRATVALIPLAAAAVWHWGRM